VIAMPRFRLSLQVSALIANDGRYTHYAVGGLGGMATRCLDEDCHSLLSATVTGAWGFDDNALVLDDVVVGALLLERIAPHIKAFLEASWGSYNRRGEWHASLDGAQLSAGLRLHGGRMAGDLGLAASFLGPATHAVYLLGPATHAVYPFASFSYRFF